MEAPSISRQRQEVIHRKLGGFYLSLGYFTKYQKFSMKLYKATGETRFLYWNVMGLLFQSIHATEKSENQISLQLARRMLEKLRIEGKIIHSEELLVYLSVLEKENLHEDRLEVIRSPLIHLLKIETDRKLLELSIRLTLRQWGEIYDLCYTRLVDRMDFTDWKFYEGLITAVLELTKEGDRVRYGDVVLINKILPEPDDLLSRLESTRTLLSRLIRENTEKDRVDRSLIISQLELESRLMSCLSKSY